VIRIEPTDDLATVKRLGLDAGLDDSEREGEAVLAAWLAVDDESGAAAGAIALEWSRDMDTINWLSVTEPWRGRGVAARLLAELESEARRRGMARLFLTARAPGFFATQGYREVTDVARAALLLGDCPQCAQYGHGCTPRPMVKELGGEAVEQGGE
jgi:N-acetylglutamate synthase-like GNAT family acetyltransferase